MTCPAEALSASASIRSEYEEWLRGRVELFLSDELREFTAVFWRISFVIRWWPVLAFGHVDHVDQAVGGPHGYLGPAGKWSTYGPHGPHTTFLTAG